MDAAHIPWRPLGPTLALTLAQQCGVELTLDEGFGTGLRSEIVRRHEGERTRLRAVPEDFFPGGTEANGNGNGNGHATEDFLSELEDRNTELATLREQLSDEITRETELENL